MYDPVKHGKQALRKEAVETGDHSARVGEQSLESLHYGFPLERFSVSEAYVEGELCCHVHLRAAGGSGAVTGDWCAVFERSRQPLVGNDLASDGVVGKATDERADDVEATVLINDVHLVDQPEVMEPLIAVPSSVRLQPADLCQGATLHASKLFWSLYLPPENGLPGRPVRHELVLEDRELGVLIERTVDLDERKRGVVECAAEGVDALTRERTPFLNRRVLDDLDAPKNVIPWVRVKLGQHSVGVALMNEAIVLGYQLAEMFLCPLELHPGVTKLFGSLYRRPHALTSS